jgi:hypothetical protein
MGRVEVSFAWFRFVEHPHTGQSIQTEKDLDSKALQTGVGLLAHAVKRKKKAVHY